jgi:ABC-type transport system involved in multi-copper enzyme maturation permease subunit
VKAWIDGVRVVLLLELMQRVRGVAWYILLGVYFLIVGLVTVLTWIAASLGGGGDAGDTIYSVVVYFVLLLASLVTPALSGNSVNGDRDAGTLATTQVTLVTTGQIIVGKFLAAWLGALAFLVASVPFLVLSGFIGGLHPDVVVVSILVLAAELGLIAAIGVGLSALVTRALFSIVLTYLAVAALSVGTLIAFGLGSAVIQTPGTESYTDAASYDENTGVGIDCGPPTVTPRLVPRPDLMWGVLAANPYVVLADATPTYYDHDQPVDGFGFIKLGLRQAQITPEFDTVYDACDPANYTGDGSDSPTPRETIDSTVPGWAVGLGVHVRIAAAVLWGAWMRLRTPARRLAAGSRIA